MYGRGDPVPFELEWQFDRGIQVRKLCKLLGTKFMIVHKSFLTFHKTEVSLWEFSSW